MPRRPGGPLEPDLNKRTRKRLARRMRALLAAATLSIGEIADQLEVEPEAIVVGLRQLRSQRRGRVRSTIRFGHVCWWWEPLTNAQDLPTPDLPQTAPRSEKAELTGQDLPTVASELVTPSAIEQPDEQRPPDVPAKSPTKKKRAAPTQRGKGGKTKGQKRPKKNSKKAKGRGESKDESAPG